MSYKSRGNTKTKENYLLSKARPIDPLLKNNGHILGDANIIGTSNLQPVKEEIKEYLTGETQETSFKSEVKRFIEISKYFSSPLRKTASYVCENCLVSYPYTCRIEYIRGSVTTHYIKCCNLTLEPVYVKLFKVIPDLEQVKFINMSLSRCKRVPPGLCYKLGVAYDDVEEKAPFNARMIFVASRKTSTPCYQICEVNLQIVAQKF